MVGRCWPGRSASLARGWRWCRRNPIPAGLTALLALVLIGGLSGILYQWHQTDAARREAVANAAQARQVLSELIQSSQVTPLIDDFPQPPSIEPLLKAAEHCRELLQNNPEDIELRIALTNVYGCLGMRYYSPGPICRRGNSYRPRLAIVGIAVASRGGPSELSVLAGHNALLAGRPGLTPGGNRAGMPMASFSRRDLGTTGRGAA